MKTRRKKYLAEAVKSLTRKPKPAVRQQLNADSMFAAIRHDFAQLPDHRANNSRIPMADALMSGFAVFSLKHPSLLAFEEHYKKEPDNLHGVFGVAIKPSDSQMRETLDEVSPELLRQPFRTIFSMVQRGKALEQLAWLDGHYLLALDGTGIYSSEKVGSDYCLKKRKRNGRTEYYMMMLAGAIVHPDRREVIPICPEMIQHQDGSVKGDCERNASRRLLPHLRREHPHLKLVVIEDALGANAPHIKDLIAHDLRFILAVKPTGHPSLFEQIDLAVKEQRATEFTMADPEDPRVSHAFRIIKGVPLNKVSQDELAVNVLEYWEVDAKGKELRFSWVTDWEITPENAYQVMRAARARWRIENETFNTLKNQGYNLGHNYGLGKKHLCAVFALLMMLAFLVDQIQQLACPLFQAALQTCKRKCYLWRQIRSCYDFFIAGSMAAILGAIVDNVKVYLPDES